MDEFIKNALNKLNQRENTGVKFISSMELPFTGCDEVVGSIWT